MTTAPWTFAFYGRVSTEDAQVPSLSIPRQLAACRRALEPAGGEIVATYWDVSPVARRSPSAATAPTSTRSPSLATGDSRICSAPRRTAGRSRR